MVGRTHVHDVDQRPRAGGDVKNRDRKAHFEIAGTQHDRDPIQRLVVSRQSTQKLETYCS